uniref:Spindle assembly abnormal protein 6 homolog n=1 Tax=Knipowitschia caucasica TaxID=637954 RepID=A0AAV2KWT3_KNICA
MSTLKQLFKLNLRHNTVRTWPPSSRRLWLRVAGVQRDVQLKCPENTTPDPVLSVPCTPVSCVLSPGVLCPVPRCPVSCPPVSCVLSPGVLCPVPRCPVSCPPVSCVLSPGVLWPVPRCPVSCPPGLSCGLSPGVLWPVPGVLCPGTHRDMEQLFSKTLTVSVRTRDCEERKSSIRITVDQSTTSAHKRSLCVKLTDDSDPYFLFNLSISEEDFQSLKVQQGLLVDFSSFPQKFIELLNLCHSEQDANCPRFLLQLCSQGPAPEGLSTLSVVETNAFKHLNHLSLRLSPGSDRDVKDYLASCLARLKEDKDALELRLKKTEDDLSRQLSCTQQTLCEKSKELDKLRSEWAEQSSSLSSRYSSELQREREKASEVQRRLQEQTEQLRQELESSHRSSSQQLQSRVTELEASCRELTEKKYKNEASVRDLRLKLVAAEEESQRSSQQLQSLRRDYSSLDSQLHEKQRVLSQLQLRAAVLQQEIKDKDLLMSRTKDVLEATQQQKVSIEDNVEGKDVQIKKLEATVKSLSEELLKANNIIQKLQTEVKGLMGKIKVKNTVTVSQEKVLHETSDKLQSVEKDLMMSQQQLSTKDQQICVLKEQLEGTVQKLNESREVLKTNENVISWLNKQLNERQVSRVGPQEPAASSVTKSPVYPLGAVPLPPAGGALCAAADHRGLDVSGLDSKYFERMDSIPIYGLAASFPNKVAPPDGPQEPHCPAPWASEADEELKEEVKADGSNMQQLNLSCNVGLLRLKPRHISGSEKAVQMSKKSVFKWEGAHFCLTAMHGDQSQHHAHQYCLLLSTSNQGPYYQPGSPISLGLSVTQGLPSAWASASPGPPISPTPGLSDVSHFNVNTI